MCWDLVRVKAMLMTNLPTVQYASRPRVCKYRYTRPAKNINMYKYKRTSALICTNTNTNAQLY